jgi:hypothetical protein
MFLSAFCFHQKENQILFLHKIETIELKQTNVGWRGEISIVGNYFIESNKIFKHFSIFDQINKNFKIPKNTITSHTITYIQEFQELFKETTILNVKAHRKFFFYFF